MLILFTRSENGFDKIEVGTFKISEDNKKVVFFKSNETSPVSDEDFDFLFGKTYLDYEIGKEVSFRKPVEYMRGLLYRFSGSYSWVEKSKKQ